MEGAIHIVLVFTVLGILAPFALAIVGVIVTQTDEEEEAAETDR